MVYASNHTIIHMLHIKAGSLVHKAWHLNQPIKHEESTVFSDMSVRLMAKSA